MIRKAFYINFFFLLICVGRLYAQGLTGTWEGTMSGEIIQVNIIQKKTQLCGYTYDYAYGNARSYCKAYFKGWYDKTADVWILNGISFIENSGGHILMELKLWFQPGDGKNILRGTVGSASVSLFSLGNRDRVQLKRISTSPTKLPGNMPLCFPEKSKPSPPVTKMPSPAKPALVKSKPSTIKKDSQPILVTKTDSLNKNNTQPISSLPNNQNDQSELFQKMNARKKNAFSHLIVNEKNITLTLYDNGIVDNDTVSVFYNGKLLAGKKRLSEKPLVINLELDEKAALHEIIMYAENLGTIAPNTALIVVNAGGKRYELHSSASLTENAVLVFEYKPN